MRPINNFENVKPVDGFEKPGNGGYILEIVAVEDVHMNSATGKGDYLKISYDIAAGEFTGYYKAQHDRFGGEWYANFIRSYKEKALGMFKHFTNCIEDSNNGFRWNWNEQSLIRCKIGAVLQEEEYEKKDGGVGVKLVVKEIKTVQQIIAGDFRVPETKRLARSGGYPAPTPGGYYPVEDNGDLPF